MNKVVILIAIAGLAACAPQHPLTYVSQSDPAWSISPPPAISQPTQQAPAHLSPSPPLDYRIHSSMVIR